MIGWMLYATVVGVLLGVAALFVERAARMYGRAGRFLWAAALASSIALPIAMAFRGATTPVTAGRESVVAFDASGVIRMPVAAIERVGVATLPLDAILVVGWITTSIALLAWLVWSWRLLRRERARWTVLAVDGRRVFVSPDMGPAVVDPLEGGVVVPRWLLTAPAAERDIALRHEFQHLVASDHRLLWLALLGVIAVPWNLALWWQLRRLRHAVELDCDRRVLAGGTAPRAYAELLLKVVHEHRVRVLRPSLSEQRSFLRWRIAAMIQQRMRFRVTRSVAYGAAGAALVFVACETRVPELPGEEGSVTESTAAVSPSERGAEYAGQAPDATPQRISCPLPEYPTLMQQAQIEGQVMLHFVVTSEGMVDSTQIEVLDASHRAFEAPARRMIAGCRFRPARVDGKPVRALVQMPVMFRLHRGADLGAPGSASADPEAIRITAGVPEGGIGTMRGTVYDPLGRPLAGARVLVAAASRSTVTNEAGAYSLDVPAGVYSVRAEFDGYSPTQMQGVRLRSGETLTADFRLAEYPGPR